MAIQVGFFGYRALVNKPLTSYFKDFTVSVLFYITLLSPLTKTQRD